MLNIIADMDEIGAIETRGLKQISSHPQVSWKCLVRPGSRLHKSETNHQSILHCEGRSQGRERESVTVQEVP